MVQLVVTETMQGWINHFKNTSGIVDALFDNLPDGLVVPDIVTNPLLLTVTLNNKDNSGTYIARVIVPDVIYNSSALMPIPIDQFQHIAEYNLAMSRDPGCLLCPPELFEWIHPETFVFTPLMGIHYDPVDQLTLDNVNLQTVIQQIKEIPEVTDVVLFEYHDPAYLSNFDTEHSYKVHVYYGDAESRYDGKNNISFALRKETYEREDSIPSIVDNARSLVEADILLNQTNTQQGT